MQEVTVGVRGSVRACSPQCRAQCAGRAGEHEAREAVLLRGGVPRERESPTPHTAALAPEGELGRGLGGPEKVEPWLPFSVSVLVSACENQGGGTGLAL